MQDTVGNPLGGPPIEGDVAPQDRERAHLEHMRIVEDAAKDAASDAPLSDADIISQATARHLEEVVKPSLLPIPNSVNPNAPTGVPDVDEDEA